MTRLCADLDPESVSSALQVEDVTEADIISTVEFDHTGNYLATGDKGGRVVLFERHESKKQTCEYKFYTEFQSHDAKIRLTSFYLQMVSPSSRFSAICRVPRFHHD